MIRLVDIEQLSNYPIRPRNIDLSEEARQRRSSFFREPRFNTLYEKAALVAFICRGDGINWHSFMCYQGYLEEYARKFEKKFGYPTSTNIDDLANAKIPLIVKWGGDCCQATHKLICELYIASIPDFGSERWHIDEGRSFPIGPNDIDTNKISLRGDEDSFRNVSLTKNIEILISLAQRGKKWRVLSHSEIAEEMWTVYDDRNFFPNALVSRGYLVRRGRPDKEESLEYRITKKLIIEAFRLAPKSSFFSLERKIGEKAIA